MSYAVRKVNPKRIVRPWSDHDIGELQGMDYLTAKEVGEILNRSPMAVWHARKRIRSGNFPNNPTYDEDEIDFIRRTPGLTAKQVAENLIGRSTSSVNNMRCFLTRKEGIDFTARKSPLDIGPRRLLAKTCIGCGLLLDGSWFASTGRRGWRSQCSRCISRTKTETKDKRPPRKPESPTAIKSRTDRIQAITRERANRHGFPWIDADHVVLRDTSLTVFEKAIRLGRTYLAAKQAVTKYSYTSRVGKGDPMKGVWHINNPNEHLAVSA